jgi:hypothetical protein
MEGIVWLFPALILVAVCVLLAGLRRRPPAIEQNSTRCTNCETPMSLRRVSLFQSLTFRGKWMCPHCGTRMRRRARIAGTMV